MYLIGYDIGSSSVKASLVDAASGKTVGRVQYPELELDIISRQSGWAEQHPQLWWDCLCSATKLLLQQTGVDSEDIKSIGIAYQMHGLVLVDKDYHVLRPSIIWCDSRAVGIGDEAFKSLGKEYCLSHLLNSPGNFTASKLKWVKDHEPDVYERIHKIMLPGDYIAMRMTGNISTTISGLSEGVLWDFKEHRLAGELLEYFNIDEDLIPEVVDTFGDHGNLTTQAAESLGLSAGTAVTYRAGDQPNNALSLGVFEPNQVAATGGTSGVVYGVVDEVRHDNESRVNGFAHVNHGHDQTRLGLLLCINGAGIQYSWMKQQIARDGTSYSDMERMISSVPVGSDGLRIIPFGNGAERMLSNMKTGAQVNNLQFNRHTRAHMYRAAVEGVAFAFVYGFEVLRELGLSPAAIRVGNDNLFQSSIFSNTISNLLDCTIEVIDTTGAVGAAKASGIGAGIYSSIKEAFSEMKICDVRNPINTNGVYQHAYHIWHNDLQSLLDAHPSPSELIPTKIY